MKILLSAYACEPGRGSEPGVGWRWAHELAAAGHEVVVLTRSNNQSVITAAKVNPSLRFVYYDLPWIFKKLKRGPKFAKFYYVLWQIGAYSTVRQLLRKELFELIHHLTFSDFRTYSPLVHLDVPFVIGPLGGAECAPPSLLRSLPIQARVTEHLRSLAILAAQLNPLTRAMYGRASLILCKTPETLAAIPKAKPENLRLSREIGSPDMVTRSSLLSRAADQEFRLIYAGRLVYWKGLHLALKAYAIARQKDKALQFTIVGEGRDRNRLIALAQELELDESVCWHSHVPQQQLFEIQQRAHAFIFPSLHDSGGSVVLEAFAHGLPVLCLRTGGPGLNVDESCGYRVPVQDRPEEEIVQELAAQILKWSSCRNIWLALATQALEKAAQMSWPATVAEAYSHIDAIMSAHRSVHSAATSTRVDPFLTY